MAHATPHAVAAITLIALCGGTLATGASDGGHVNWNYAFEGNVAMKVSFYLPEPSQIWVNNSQSWAGSDYDWLLRMWGMNLDTNERRGVIAGASSWFGEIGVNVGNLRIRGMSDFISGPQDYWAGWSEFPFGKGNWTFHSIRGVSEPVTQTSFEFGLPIGVRPSVEFSRNVGFISPRDFDDGVSSYNRAATGVTAAVTVAEETVQVRQGLSGFSLHVNSTFDAHQFTRTHDGETMDLGELFAFNAEEAGDYTFQLTQVAAGPGGPGRAVVLWADLNMQPASS